MELSAQKELVLRVVTRVAEKNLSGIGRPTFAATVGRSRRVQLFMQDESQRTLTPQEIEANWVEQLAEVVQEQDCSTIAYYIDMRFETEGVVVAKAALIHLEQKDGSAEDILYRYNERDIPTIDLQRPNIQKVMSKVFRCNKVAQ